MTDIDLSAWIAPIGENQVGANIHPATPTYRGIKSAFNMAQSALSKLVDADAADRPRLSKKNREIWQELSQRCDQVIKTQSKDVECAILMMIASLAEEDRWSALLKSVRLLEALFKTYGLALYPASEGPDESRLKEKLKYFGLLEGGSLSESWFYGPMVVLFPLGGELSFGQLSVMKTKSPKEFLALSPQYEGASSQGQAEVAAVKEVIGALSDLEEAVRSLSPNSKFRLNTPKKILSDYIALIAELLHLPEDIEPEAPVESAPEASDKPLPEAAPSNRETPKGASRAQGAYTRESAIADLERVADFFDKNEPSSPVPILVRRAISWANMGFEDLLREILSNNKTALQEVQSQIGSKK